MVVTGQSSEPDEIVVWRGDFTPFGEKIEREWSFVDTHGFTGKDWDEDAGLYYFNARWYDPELGRFISEDPVGDPNNPNLYVYCANNPLRYIDPTGCDWEDTTTVVITFADGKTLTFSARNYNSDPDDSNRGIKHFGLIESVHTMHEALIYINDKFILQQYRESLAYVGSQFVKVSFKLISIILTCI